MTNKEAEKRGLQKLVTIKSWASCGVDPAIMGTGPIPSSKKALEIAGWSIKDVDLFEINEAFSVVPIVAIKDLKLNIEKVNIHGGAVSIGHPIGCSGSRIIMSLINALKVKNKQLGVAAICIGGGEATAILIENIN